MRTEWKKGAPNLVHYLVIGSGEHIAKLETEMEEIRKAKEELVRKQSYEDAAMFRTQEKQLLEKIEIAKCGMHFIGPYHNRPSKKLAELKGARVVSYNLIEIKQ